MMCITQLMKGNKKNKNTSQHVLFMGSEAYLFIFMFFFSFFTRPSYGHAGHQWIYSALSKMMTYTKLCCWEGVCLPWGGASLCSCLVWPLLLACDEENYYTIASSRAYLPSSAQDIRLVSFKVALLLFHSRSFVRFCCLPRGMLMGPTNVLRSSWFCSHVTFLFFLNWC